MVPLATILVTGFVAACMIVDLRTRRIPNVLTLPALLAGVALQAGYGGAAGIATSVAGAAIAIAVLSVPFALGGIGGGDVKMMGAIGALVGPRLGVASLAVGMVLGGVIMTAHLARLGLLRAKMR